MGYPLQQRTNESIMSRVRNHHAIPRIEEFDPAPSSSCNQVPYEAYCATCKASVCNECLPTHTSHKVSPIAELLSEYNKVAKHFQKEFSQILQSAHQRILTLRSDAITTTDRSLYQLELQLSSFSDMVRSRYITAKNDIVSDAAKILSEFTKVMDKETEHPAFQTVELSPKFAAVLDSGALHFTFKEKITMLSGLMQEVDGLKTRLETFGKEFGETQTALGSLESHVDRQLALLGKGKLKALQELEALKFEQQEELSKKIRKNVELNFELHALESERDEVKEKVEKIREELKRLDEKFAQMTKECSEFDEKMAAYSQAILDKKELVANLDGIVIAKQNLLAKLEQDVSKLTAEGDLKPFPAKKSDSTALSSELVTAAKVKGEMGSLSSSEQQKLIESKLVHFYDTKANTLYIYHVEMHKVFKLTGEDIQLPTNHDSVQIGSKILLTGGFDPIRIEFSTASFLIEIINNCTIEKSVKACMRQPRSQHKLVALTSTIVYSLGGKNQTEKFMNTCERYDFSQDKWTDAPSLTQKKFYLSACAFNSASIYAFGGHGSAVYSTIEVLKPEVENKWKVVKVVAPEEWGPREEAASVQVSPDKIIIFGGLGVTEGCNDDVFSFNVANGVIEKCKCRLKKREWFTMRSPVKRGKFVWIFGYYFKDLHTYDADKEEWTIAEEKEWKL